MISNAPDFAKLVPGFDFLQGLVKNAGSVLPGIGQWVAPTLNPEELEKRIEELKTVQFWLDQNSRMLSTTIQALEVQKMTLSTLQTMNVQITDLRDSMRIKAPGEAAEAQSDDAPAPSAGKPPRSRAGAKAAAPAAVVDPMQWWGALTKQFTQIAAGAVKDAAAESAANAARQMAGDMLAKGNDLALQTIKVGMAPARQAAKVAGGVANSVVRAKEAAAKARKSAPAKAPARAARRTAKT
ncbi:MAG TPA: PhaM family polyhydroxyalkanoate granule multifunctional regulatory protein [Methylibium sp.]|uniref:PhaM family polyhydroxyalkanoate granule multifunctional regulatory protein n=1 Tax=Methylibium sp. TaxID=2067992 RepID=UPI002DBA5299|nr:PhaM family polyhydroxyalkanoate granule multifunctional regulatory protein [Methylibium sp.]HEU4460344.1 PhaM family polyhydroxyalkanoate granule multifunctional regulatory protein [Methylibium sp.]